MGRIADVTASERAFYYLQLVLQNSPISFSVIDQTGRLLFGGGGFDQDFVDALASARTESVFEVFKEQRGPLALLRRALLGEPISQVVEAFGRSLDLHLTPIRDPTPDRRSVVAVATDVTDRELARGEQAVLAEIAHIALRTVELDALWVSAASVLGRWLNAGVVVFEVRRADGGLHLVAESGPPPPSTATAVAAETAKTAKTALPSSEPSQDGGVRQVDGLSMLSVPVGRPGEPDAVVTLYRPVDPSSNDETGAARASTPTSVHPAGSFTGRETDFVRAVADVLGSAAVRFAMEREIRHRSLHDPLTELPNRAALLGELDGSLRRARRGHQTGVVFVDLDGFKTVNDSYGHRTGDSVLREVAYRLRHSIRPGDVVGRLAGDEFAVLCENVQSHDEVERVAHRIVVALARPIDVEGTTVTVTASAGVAVSGGDLDDPDRLLAASDDAMYAAKRTGAGRYVVHTPATEPGTRNDS